LANNPYLLINRNKLEELIKTDQIMFLQWDSGKIVHKLTKEESDMLRKKEYLMG